MKVLIIAPQYKNPGVYYELPLGLAYISSNLKKHGYFVNFINENEEIIIHGSNYYKWLAEKIKNSDVLCTGGLSVHYHQIKRVISNAKKINPSIKIITGGGIISSEPELMTREFNSDHSIIGEGEETIVKLLNGEITNKIIKSNYIGNLDDMPFPDFEGLKVKNYLDRQLCGDEHYTYPFDKPRALPIISSRSCPYSCTFCYHPIGQKYRQRSLENFFSEVEFLKSKYNINILCVLDELISDDQDRLYHICRELKNYKLKWMTQIRVSNINIDLIKMLKESGCFQLSFGIEHINNNILSEMNKKTSRKEIENALELAYNWGIGIQGNILFGTPAENLQTMMEALTWWKKNIKYAINLSYVIPYPGSKLYLDYVKSGVIIPLNYIRNGCPFINNYFNFPEVVEVENSMKEFNKIPGKLLKMKKLSRDIYRGQLYEVEIECPHCKSYNNYKNIYPGGTNSEFLKGAAYRIACRSCNQRMDFNLVSKYKNALKPLKDKYYLFKHQIKILLKFLLIKHKDEF